MARRSNTSQTVQVTISTTPAIHAVLEKLAEGGLYGKNPADVALGLLTNRILKAMETNEFETMLQNKDRLLSFTSST